MKSTEFKKFLFRSAVSAMAIDGTIHKAEMEELKTLVEKSAYFFDLDFDEELNENLFQIKRNGKEAINNYLSVLANNDLSEKQEAILVDVLLKIISADKKYELTEIKFLHMVKSRIKITEDVLIVKFPKYVDHLIDFNNFGSSLRFEHDVLLT